MQRFALIVLLSLALTLFIPACGGLSEAERHYNAGVELHEQGRLQEAIAEYDIAIRLNPQYAEAYCNRGNAYGRLGQLERAIEDFDEAIRLNPGLATAYYNRAVGYTVLGMDIEAEQDIEKAVELGVDPDFLREGIESLKQLR